MKLCWRAGWLAGDGGRGHPARRRRWAVQVRVFTLHTGAGWAWWRVSVRPRLGGVLVQLIYSWIISKRLRPTI